MLIVESAACLNSDLREERKKLEKQMLSGATTTTSTNKNKTGSARTPLPPRGEKTTKLITLYNNTFYIFIIYLIRKCILLQL